MTEFQRNNSLRTVSLLAAALAFVAATGSGGTSYASSQVLSDVTALAPCDEAAGARASLFNRFVLVAVANGTMTKEQAAPLNQLAADLESCVANKSAYWTVDAASQSLAEIKAKYEAGIATRLEVMPAEQGLLAAQFCADSLANTSEQERLIDIRIQAGVDTPLRFEPTIKNRLAAATACAR